MHPLLAAAGASAAFLALAQATFFLLRNREFLGPEMAAGLTKFSVLLSVVTVLLLLPVAAFGRLERNNVAFANPEPAERYRRRLEPQLAALMHTGEGATAQKLTPEQLEAMKALGYVR